VPDRAPVKDQGCLVVTVTRHTANPLRTLSSAALLYRRTTSASTSSR